MEKISFAPAANVFQNNLATPPVQMSDITIQHLADFVKQHFEENKNFTENVAEVLKKRLDDAYFAAPEKEMLKEWN